MSPIFPTPDSNVTLLLPGFHLYSAAVNYVLFKKALTFVAKIVPGNNCQVSN